MRDAASSALAVAAAASALAIACGAFGSNEVSTASGTEAGTSEASAAEGGPPEAAPPGSCALTSTPTVIANVTSAPSRLQTNGEHVFWIEGGTRVVRASLADCSSSALATGNITALAVDAQWILWGEPHYRLLRRNDTSSAPKTSDADVSPELLLAGGVAYWLGPTTVGACDTPCISTTVAAIVGSPQLLAANAFRFFVFGTDSNAAGNLYWQPLLGGGDTLMGPIATGQAPILLAANADRVFWVNSDGQVKGVPAGGGTPIVLPKVVGALALAVDEAFVYVATSNAIGRVAVSGGELAILVVGEVDIQSMLVTSDAIIWGTAGAIRRVKK